MSTKRFCDICGDAVRKPRNREGWFSITWWDTHDEPLIDKQAAPWDFCARCFDLLRTKNWSEIQALAARPDTQEDTNG